MRESVTDPTPLLEVRDLIKDYESRDSKMQKRLDRAVDGVSFKVFERETFAIIGESGSGKSTIGRVILNLTEITSGEVLFRGTRISGLSERQFRKHRRYLQLVFQDPLASFDPRASIRSSINEFADLRTDMTPSEQQVAVDQAIRDVGLEPEMTERKPGQVSGGELQRLSIARSLLVEPLLVFLDEPTASLDVSIRGEVVNVLIDRQARNDLSYLLVAHDLRVVYAMATRVAVMYLGQFVEIGSLDQIYERAHHPYTRGLLEAASFDEVAKIGDPVQLIGELRRQDTSSAACRLAPRCPFAESRCNEPQTLRPVAEGHLVRCWKAVEIPERIGLPNLLGITEGNTS